MTRLTCVYVIQAGTTGPVKVGIAERPTTRMTGLQTGHYEQLMLVHTTALQSREEAEQVEATAHATLAALTDKARGEWFWVTPAQAIEAIAQATQTLTTVSLPRKKERIDDMDRLFRFTNQEFYENDPDYDDEEREKDRQTWLKYRVKYGIE